MGESPVQDRGRDQLAAVLAQAWAAKLEAGAMFERAEQMQRDDTAQRRRLDARRQHLVRADPRRNSLLN
jgi:hypothetical protein